MRFIAGAHKNRGLLLAIDEKMPTSSLEMWNSVEQIIKVISTIACREIRLGSGQGVRDQPSIGSWKIVDDDHEAAARSELLQQEQRIRAVASGNRQGLVP
jgi:hypothetical protein